MSTAILQNQTTGEMIRQRAIYGNAKKRDLAYAHHERHMAEVEEHAEPYINTLVNWIAVLKKQVVICIVGWYAEEHGLSFIESLHRLFSQGDRNFIRVCKEFGRLKTSDAPLRTTNIRPAKATTKQRHEPQGHVV